MTTHTRIAPLFLASLMFVAVGCSKDSGATGDKKTPSHKDHKNHKAAAGHDKHKAAAGHDKHKAPATDVKHDHAAAGHGATETTLKALMAQLGKDMAEIGNGLWREDFAAIAKNAKAIADHPHASLDERKRLMKTLGKDFGAFVQGDRLVHGIAVRLSEAAAKSDMAGSLKELSALQQGCVSCHASFRKRLTTK